MYFLIFKRTCAHTKYILCTTIIENWKFKTDQETKVAAQSLKLRQQLKVTPLYDVHFKEYQEMLLSSFESNFIQTQTSFDPWKEPTSRTSIRTSIRRQCSADVIFLVRSICLSEAHKKEAHNEKFIKFMLKLRFSQRAQNREFHCTLHHILKQSIPNCRRKFSYQSRALIFVFKILIVVEFWYADITDFSLERFRMCMIS